MNMSRANILIHTIQLSESIELSYTSRHHIERLLFEMLDCSHGEILSKVDLLIHEVQIAEQRKLSKSTKDKILTLCLKHVAIEAKELMNERDYWRDTFFEMNSTINSLKRDIDKYKK